MSKQKATLADIIARKKQGKSDKLQIDYYDSKTLDMKIEVRKIALSKYMDIIEELEDDNLEGMNTLIYECCPMFKENSKEAMETYEVSEPTELPSAILEDQLDEMQGIIKVINKFYGLDRIEDKIKN